MIAKALLWGLVPLALAMLALAWPLCRRRAADGGARSDVAIFKDQLGELERDEARGLIAPAEARAARLEVERRLLKAANKDADVTFEATALGRVLVVLALIALPLGSAALYWQLGAPDKPDLPIAAREAEESPAMPEQIRAMVAGLESRLAEDADDLEGWLMLGRSKLTLNDADAAVAAYRRALDLATRRASSGASREAPSGAPRESEAVAGLAEALLARATGVVTPEVRQLMFRLAELEPFDPRPLYYQGLADAQAGDYNAALDKWRLLLESTPADAPWREQVAPSIAQAARQLGLDPEPILALAAPPSPQEQRAAELAALSPEERTAQIQAMVQSLAERLAAEGGPPEAWQRLARSYLVMGDREKAAQALRQALAAHPDDPTLNKDLATALLLPPSEENGLPEVPDAALPHLEKALAETPEDPELHWYLGIRALADGKETETREHWQKVLATLDPATPEHALVQSRLDKLNVN